MRRQGQYAEAGINSLVTGQMQQHQRMPNNPAMHHFTGRPDALPGEGEVKYMASKVEGEWQWDQDGPRGSKPMSPHLYREGHGSDLAQSLYQGRRPDSKLIVENQNNKDSRNQPHENDMQSGYDQGILTLEGLEKKFHDEVMKLIKEQQDTEDAEIIRHRERVGEIHAQYQEKLMTMRARQASHRDEFLHCESQGRQLQYQQVGLNHYAGDNNMVSSDLHDYGSAMGGFGPGNLESSYKDKSQYPMGARNAGFESRGPYSAGRGYGSNSRYY